MKLKFEVEVVMDEDATLVEAHDVFYELREHLVEWRSELAVAKRVDIQVGEQLSIKI